jgi:hypothetical protein
MPGHLPLAAGSGCQHIQQSRKCASKKQLMILDIFKLFQQLFESGQKVNSLLFEKFQNLILKISKSNSCSGRHPVLKDGKNEKNAFS